MFNRTTREWLRSTWSTPSGRYHFAALRTGVEYDVISRDPTRTWQDVIVGAVKPQPYEP